MLLFLYFFIFVQMPFSILWLCDGQLWLWLWKSRAPKSFAINTCPWLLWICRKLCKNGKHIANCEREGRRHWMQKLSCTLNKICICKYAYLLRHSLALKFIFTSARLWSLMPYNCQFKRQSMKTHNLLFTDWMIASMITTLLPSPVRMLD